MALTPYPQRPAKQPLYLKPVIAGGDLVGYQNPPAESEPLVKWPDYHGNPQLVRQPAFESLLAAQQQNAHATEAAERQRSQYLSDQARQEDLGRQAENRARDADLIYDPGSNTRIPASVYNANRSMQQANKQRDAQANKQRKAQESFAREQAASARAGQEALLRLQGEQQQASQRLQEQLMGERENRRRAAIPGLLASVPGLDESKYTTADIDTGEEAATQAAFTGARERAGATGLAAVRSLRELMAGQGLHGSSVEAAGMGNIIGDARGTVGEVAKELAVQRSRRAGERASRQSQEKLTRRAQDISRQQALQSLMLGSIY